MKKNIISLFSFGSLLFLFAGCAPQLAQTKYGNVENQWKDYIHKSYREWAPPPTPPPINSLIAVGSSDSDTTGIVGEAAVQDSSTLPEVSDSNGTITLPEISAPQSVATNTETYTVKKGDTLWSISCKFYDNDGAKWKKIQEANKTILSSSGKIRPGVVLTIPPK